jgi:AcrR family transcriptional regulator
VAAAFGSLYAVQVKGPEEHAERQIEGEERDDAPPWWQPAISRRRQPLDVERIVHAAIELLDGGADVETLSLRRLGAHLGVAAASMYWHVPSKQALLDLVTDRLIGELRADVVLDPAATWRAQLAEVCRGVRRIIARHPAAAMLLARRMPLGPNGLALVEVTLRILGRAGFHGQRLVLAQGAALGYATGQAVLGARPVGARLAAEGRDEEAGPTGQLGQLGQLMRDVPRHSYPQLFAVSEEMVALTDEEQFEYGLQRMLDGLEADLRGGATPRRRF